MTDIPIPEFVRRLEENLASFDAEVAYQLSIEGERADLWDEIDVNVEDLRSLLADRAAQAERMAKLEEALKPFASYLDQAAFDLDNNGEPLPDDQGMGWVYLTVGDFRRARALSQEGSDA